MSYVCPPQCSLTAAFMHSLTLNNIPLFIIDLPIILNYLISLFFVSKQVPQTTDLPSYPPVPELDYPNVAKTNVAKTNVDNATQASSILANVNVYVGTHSLI